MASYHGFFGKLPARGDFVSAGLPRDFVSHWDAWICGVLPAALEAVADGWLQAPAWRFRLAPGMCGSRSTAGLLFPSHDKIGRPFPLTLAWLGDSPNDAAMAAAEELGRTAIAAAMPPGTLAERLTEIPAVAAQHAAGSRWQQAHARHRSLMLPALPDARQFAAMMTADEA